MTTVTENRLSLTQVAALVRRAQEGDREAFGELYVAFRGCVMGQALRRTGDTGEAQELCQEVFARAMQKIGQLQNPNAFGAWLKSITARLAINRSQGVQPAMLVDPYCVRDYEVDYRTPVTMAIDRESLLEVHACLSRLRKIDRETLHAFYVEGRSLREMSDQFQAKLGTIKRRLHDARKRIGADMRRSVATI